MLPFVLSVTSLVLIFVATFFFLQVKFIRRLHDFDLRGIEADPKVRVLMVFPPFWGWWLNQPIWQKYARQIGSFPPIFGVNIEMFETTT